MSRPYFKGARAHFRAGSPQLRRPGQGIRVTHRRAVRRRSSATVRSEVARPRPAGSMIAPWTTALIATRRASAARSSANSPAENVSVSVLEAGAGEVVEPRQNPERPRPADRDLSCVALTSAGAGDPGEDVPRKDGLLGAGERELDRDDLRLRRERLRGEPSYVHAAPSRRLVVSDGRVQQPSGAPMSRT